MDAAVTFFKGFVYLIGFGSILLVTYFTTKFIGTRANKASRGKHITVVDTVTVGMNKQLYLVKAGKEYLLLSSSGKNLEFMKEIKIDEGEESEIDLAEKNNASFDFKALFERYFQANKSKKNDNTLKNNDNTLKKNDNTLNSSLATQDRFKDNLLRLKTMTSRFGKSGSNYGDENSNEK